MNNKDNKDVEYCLRQYKEFFQSDDDIFDLKSVKVHFYQTLLDEDQEKFTRFIFSIKQEGVPIFHEVDYFGDDYDININFIGYETGSL